MKFSFLHSGSHVAKKFFDEITNAHQNFDPEVADVIVPIGGDGFMLQTMHHHLETHKPLYGINLGTVGFLMNDQVIDTLHDKISKSVEQIINPLQLKAISADGSEYNAFAINEVSILRSGPQAANLSVNINGVERMDRLMADGLIVSTPAGSTAYNYSAYGPILPISANVLALTPIAAFRPRRWRGAVIPEHANIDIRVLDAEKRPCSASADSMAFNDVVQINVKLNKALSIKVLFDPDHDLEERIISEQFQ